MTAPENKAPINGLHSERAVTKGDIFLDIGYYLEKETNEKISYVFVADRRSGQGLNGEIWGEAARFAVKKMDELSDEDFTEKMSKAMNFMGGDISHEVKREFAEPVSA